MININISLRETERRLFLPDSFILCKDTSNELNFVKIECGRTKLNIYLQPLFSESEIIQRLKIDSRLKFFSSLSKSENFISAGLAQLLLFGSEILFSKI